MLTDSVAERGPGLALRAANTLAGWVDLRSVESRAKLAEVAIDSKGGSRLVDQGLAFAVTGRLASLRHEGGLLCAAAGVPRFDAGAAADAANRHGAAAGWLALYRDHGANVFTRAHGAWSVVLVDLARRQAMIGVDRFAIRPLCFRSRWRAVLRESRRRSASSNRGYRSPGDLRLRVSPFHSRAAHDLRARFPPRRRALPDRNVAGVQGRTLLATRFCADGHAVRRAEGGVPVGVDGAIEDQLTAESVGCYLSGGTDSSTVAGMVTRITGDSREDVFDRFRRGRV
jgi:asparagine synthase (glutamine-hydrolysing)